MLLWGQSGQGAIWSDWSTNTDREGHRKKPSWLLKEPQREIPHACLPSSLHGAHLFGLGSWQLPHAGLFLSYDLDYSSLHLGKAMCARKDWCSADAFYTVVYTAVRVTVSTSTVEVSGDGLFFFNFPFSHLTISKIQKISAFHSPSAKLNKMEHKT